MAVKACAVACFVLAAVGLVPAVSVVVIDPLESEQADYSINDVVRVILFPLLMLILGMELWGGGRVRWPFKRKTQSR